MNIFGNDKIIIREAAADELERLKNEPELAPLLGSQCSIYAVAGQDGTLFGAIAQRRYAQWNMEGVVCYTFPEYRRSSYASQAVRAYTRWFYDNTSENMLIAVVELENVAAVRTVERAGYEYIRTTTLSGEDGSSAVSHLFTCSRSVADAGAPPRGCCCGCGGHAD